MLVRERLSLAASLLLASVGTAYPQIRIGPESVPALADVREDSWFGYDVDVIGDLNGNGVPDLLVGTPHHSDAGEEVGAVWILFMEADGSVSDARKYSSKNLDLSGPLNEQFIGSRVNALGDFRNKGVYEITIASKELGRFLRLNATGEVVSVELLPSFDSPEPSVIVIGDIDGNGALDLAETRQNSKEGTVEIIPYSTSGDAELRARVRIGNDLGGLPDILITNDHFGWDASNIGDLDGDGRDELVAGAPGDDDRFQESGAVYVLFLTASGNVQRYQKISATAGNFRGELHGGDRFGTAVENLGDLDGDGLNELAVGAPGDDAGVVWVLSLNPDGTVRHESKLRLVDYGIPIQDKIAGNFEHGLALAPDFGGDGIPDLAVGFPQEGSAGSVWFLPALADLESVAQFFEVDPDAAKAGANIPISVAASGVGGVSGVKISFRIPGYETYLSTPMPLNGDRYEFDIPAFATGSRGLEYYVTVSNAAGKETRQPPDDIVSVPLTVPDGVTVSVPAGDSASGYRIVSVPLEYDDLSLLDMLESSLGTSNKSNWRAFTLSNGNVKEVADRTELVEPGTAFWLLSSQTGTVIRPGPGRTVRTDEPVRIPLEPGWNLVGNPFDFPLPLNSLSIVRGSELDIRSYHGDWEMEQDGIRAREGYAVFSPLLDTLIIDPGTREGSSPQRASSAAADLAWSLKVDAVVGRARDRGNTFGVADEATAGWDGLDAAEPPPIGDFVSAYFVDESRSGPTSRLQTDIRGPVESSETWNLEVSTARQQIVTLKFVGIESLPADLDVVLSDPMTGVVQNLNRNPAYVLVSGSANIPRRLDVTAGRNLNFEEASVTPTPTESVEVFPNPFDAAATVRFTLTEPSTTIISVYDVVGRLVSVLTNHDDLQAGVHTVLWDGLDSRGISVSNGLYFIRLEAGSRSTSTTVTIAR